MMSVSPCSSMADCLFQIYMAALFPNIEADISRDHVLQQHIGRLSEVVSPNHRDLKIPKRYQYECPWPAAQVRCWRSSAQPDLLYSYRRS